MRPSRKNPDIRDMQSKIMGVDVVASINADICVVCKNAAAFFTSEITAREFSISGMCEPCQDKVWSFMEDLAEEDIESEDLD